MINFTLSDLHSDFKMRKKKSQQQQYDCLEKSKRDFFLSDSVIILQLSEGGQNNKFLLFLVWGRPKTIPQVLLMSTRLKS